MKFNSDIDIDFADRNKLLEHIDVTIASIRKEDVVKKHNTGVHITAIPYDPVHDIAALDYNTAEERGYIKIDLLNVFVYKAVRDENHLINLMHEPDWNRLNDRNFFEKLVHIGKHYDVMQSLPEPINSIPRMAMFLALIRPGKKHLQGKAWKEISETIWEKNTDGYSFKKSHSIGYAHLVVVHMNLLEENPMAFSSQE